MSGALLVSLVLLNVGSGLAPARVPQGTPPALREVGFDQKLSHQVPLDIPFTDETGRAVRLGDYFGKKPVVLSLVYYECPMLCTLTLNGLTSALAVMSFDVGKEFEVVTVSFEPKETWQLAAAKKAAYMKRYKRPGADAGWHFLVGDKAAIDRLAQAVGFRYAWDENTRQYAHPSGIVTLTPQGRISHYLFGIEYAPKDLRLSLVRRYWIAKITSSAPISTLKKTLIAIRKKYSASTCPEVVEAPSGKKKLQFPIGATRLPRAPSAGRGAASSR